MTSVDDMWRFWKLPALTRDVRGVVSANAVFSTQITIAHTSDAASVAGSVVLQIAPHVDGVIPPVAGAANL